MNFVVINCFLCYKKFFLYLIIFFNEIYLLRHIINKSYLPKILEFSKKFQLFEMINIHPYSISGFENLNLKVIDIFIIYFLF